MSWAEFVLRSIGFKERMEFEMKMTREIAYEVHTLKYIFGKKRPPLKDKWWPIGKAKSISTALIDRFRKVRKQYLERNNG